MACISIRPALVDKVPVEFHTGGILLANVERMRAGRQCLHGIGFDLCGSQETSFRKTVPIGSQYTMDQR